jgi:hypothetical protein
MTSDPSVCDDPDLPRAAVRLPRPGAGRAFGEIEKYLANHPAKLAGFLEPAEKRLIFRSDEFTVRLGIKAIDIAGDRGASAVDFADIESAYRALAGPSPSEKQAWFLGIGTLAGGAALGTAATLSSGSVPGAPFWWIGVGVSAVLSVILLYRTWPRRHQK